MTDLHVDAACLFEMSAQLARLAERARPARGLEAPPPGVLGSREVAAALGDGSAQLTVRAQVTADDLHRAGSAPASAARGFVAADAALARVV